MATLLKKNYLEKLLGFLEARPAIGGLEISDVAVRFAYFSGKSWILKSVRIPPGVLEAGKAKDRDKLIGALRELHAQILGTKSRKRINAIVVVSSLDVYS
ncbi:hypothetical protein C4587_00305, partial [Candidatus Parcubacteria bacterium]